MTARLLALLLVIATLFPTGAQAMVHLCDGEVVAFESCCCRHDESGAAEAHPHVEEEGCECCESQLAEAPELAPAMAPGAPADPVLELWVLAAPMNLPDPDWVEVGEEGEGIPSARGPPPRRRWLLHRSLLN